jgi:hypothetical protein
MFIISDFEFVPSALPSPHQKNNENKYRFANQGEWYAWARNVHREYQVAISDGSKFNFFPNAIGEIR